MNITLAWALHDSQSLGRLPFCTFAGVVDAGAFVICLDQPFFSYLSPRHCEILPTDILLSGVLRLLTRDFGVLPSLLDRDLEEDSGKSEPCAVAS